MKNILYLMWGENIVDYGIFESQVFRKLEYLKGAGRYDFFVLSGIPVGKKYLSGATDYTRKLERIKSRFAAKGIDFCYRNVLKISPHFHAQWWALPFLHMFHIRFLASHIKGHGIDLVHCRSYHAALLALLTRALFRMKFKVVFDTRGLVPEEGILIGAYKEHSFSYRCWKWIEKRLLDSSDAVVNVSDNFSEHVAVLTGNPNVHTIYTGVDTGAFCRDPVARCNAGRSLGIGEDVRVLAYAGSLGEKGWHSPELLAEVYAAFKKCFNTSLLLVISSSNARNIALRLEESGIGREDYKIVEGSSPDEVAFYLQRGDYAAFSYREIHGKVEETISRTVIAIKTGEYFACGLPLIVNRCAGAAADMVERYGTGIVFDPGNVAEIGERIPAIEKNYGAVSGACRKVALEFFDYERNTGKYLDIYSSLLAG